MTKLKCPVCKTGNVKEYADSPYYVCDNQYCPSYEETDFTTYDILIDTKKKLDIAVDALFDIHKHSYACCTPASEIGYIHTVSYNALDKTGNGLTQINQKEEK